MAAFDKTIRVIDLAIINDTFGFSFPSTNTREPPVHGLGFLLAQSASKS
jgi:hypothetical protein